MARAICKECKNIIDNQGICQSCGNINEIPKVFAQVQVNTVEVYVT